MKIYIKKYMPSELKCAVKVFEKELKLSSTSAMLIVNNDAGNEIKKNLGCMTYRGNDEYHIYINDKASLKEQIVTLAHEMVHVQQAITKKLSRVSGSEHLFYWCGNVYDQRKIAWENRPWEIDAMKKQYELSNHYFFNTTKRIPDVVDVSIYEKVCKFLVGSYQKVIKDF